MNNGETEAPKGSVLVVDDTHDNLRLIAGILTKEGYSVRPVPDGELALVSAQKALPDLILLDIMMPALSGYEVCEQLKADDRTRDIPVIFISALHEVVDKVQAFSLGGVDFITKPFQAEEVVARVETHMALRSLHKKLQGNNALLQQEIQERIQAENSLKESIIQIERAKQEWESTADSLSYVVCLLDEQRRIVRSNRTVELWNLGEVLHISGQDVHTVFHAQCNDSACYLNTFLSQAWKNVAEGNVVESEAKDPILNRYLHIQIRSISIHQQESIKPSGSFAVLCVHDITKRKHAEETVRQRNCELAVLNQMSALLQACHSEDETYPVIASVCKDLFPADSGCLYMTGRSQSLLDSVFSWGKTPSQSEAFSMNDCCCLYHGNSFLVPLPDEAPLCDHLDVSPEHGYICAPIDTSDRRPGVLHLFFGPPEHGYSESEYRHQLELKRMIITRVAEQYALSIANLRLRDSLRKESIRDPLTDLYNRRYMEESLQREAQRAKRNHTPIGIIMLDIDHFKSFNDTHGHKAGDVVLRELGALLESNIRGGDIACRYGGEEFLLILPDVGLETTHTRAQELLMQVRKLTIPHQEAYFQITISIGVSVFTEDSPGIQAILDAADKALYQAKEQGRNQVVVAS